MFCSSCVESYPRILFQVQKTSCFQFCKYSRTDISCFHQQLHSTNCGNEYVTNLIPKQVVTTTHSQVSAACPKNYQKNWLQKWPVHNLSDWESVIIPCIQSVVELKSLMWYLCIYQDNGQWKLLTGGQTEMTAVLSTLGADNLQSTNKTDTELSQSGWKLFLYEK